jgi:hypothetical protein
MELEAELSQEEIHRPGESTQPSQNSTGCAHECLALCRPSLWSRHILPAPQVALRGATVLSIVGAVLRSEAASRFLHLRLLVKTNVKTSRKQHARLKLPCRADVDLSRHFSYYAFEGQNGILRWKHEVNTGAPAFTLQLLGHLTLPLSCTQKDSQIYSGFALDSRLYGRVLWCRAWTFTGMQRGCGMRWSRSTISRSLPTRWRGATMGRWPAETSGNLFWQ